MIIPFKCKDKDFQEKYNEKTPQNLAHAFRMIISGTCNSGKTTYILNVLLNQKPPFDKIYLMHPTGNTSKDYELIDYELITEMPDMESWSNELKKIIIIDDVNYNMLNKADKYKMDRTFGHNSSHCSLSIIYACQQIYQVPRSFRSMANIVVLYKIEFRSFCDILQKLFSVDKHDAKKIREMLKDKHDSMLFDKDLLGHPHFMRKNLFEPVNYNLD